MSSVGFRCSQFPQLVRTSIELTVSMWPLHLPDISLSDVCLDGNKEAGDCDDDRMNYFSVRKRRAEKSIEQNFVCRQRTNSIPATGFVFRIDFFRFGLFSLSFTWNTFLFVLVLSVSVRSVRSVPNWLIAYFNIPWYLCIAKRHRKHKDGNGSYFQVFVRVCARMTTTDSVPWYRHEYK